MTTATSFQEKSPLFVGVDLAKAVFQTAYKDSKTSRFYNRQLSRTEFRQFLIKHQEPLCIGMEACGSAHYWGAGMREARTSGTHYSGTNRKVHQ